MFAPIASRLLAHGLKAPRMAPRLYFSSHDTSVTSAVELLRSAGGSCNSSVFGILGKPPEGDSWPEFLKTYPETFSVERASDDPSHNFKIKLKSEKVIPHKSTLDATVAFLSGRNKCDISHVCEALQAYKPPGKWLPFFKAHGDIFHLQQRNGSGWDISLKETLDSARPSKLTQMEKQAYDKSPIPKLFPLSDGSKYQLIDDEATLDLALHKDGCLKPGQGQSRQFVAVDCEGVPENIHLLQLSTDKGTYVVDCKSIGPRTVCQKLRKLFTSTDVIKVLHDLECDAQAIYEISGIQLDGVLDTQLVSKHLWDIPYKTGLNDYLLRMDLPTHPSKHLLKQWQGDVKPWTVRPLDRQYQDYAALDVALLQKSIGPMLDKLTEHDLTSLLASSSEKAAQENQADKSISDDHQTTLGSLCIEEYTSHTITDLKDLDDKCMAIYNSGTSVVVFRMQKNQAKSKAIDIIYDTTHLKINCAEIPAEDVIDTVDWINCRKFQIVTIMSNPREIQDVLARDGSFYPLEGFVDVAILGELIFGTPFLSEESFLRKLFFRHFGVSVVSKDAEKIYAALLEKELKLLTNDGFSLPMLIEASMLSNGSSRQICFDRSHKLQSLNLFDNLNKDGERNAFLGEPLVEQNDFESIMDVLPERLRSEFPTSSTGSITEIVLDIGRRPIFWNEDQRFFLTKNLISWC